MVHKKLSSPNKNSADLLELVYQTYEDLGFPRHIINQWSIAHTDVADLLAYAQAVNPKKILEIGTFVGVSTMLLAKCCEDAEIVTIDPNFPLSDLLGSMGSELGGLDPHIRIQSLALQAAEKLGVADRIRFVEGGFSTADSFSSRLGQDTHKFDVVGPKVCETYGPFEFIFADGLHFEDDVFADVELASSGLSERGLLMFHDCIGMWGRNVRSGLYHFLTEQPDWRLVTAPYSDLYRSIGIVYPHDRAPKNELVEYAVAARPTLDPVLQRKINHNLNIVKEVLGSTKILEIVCDKFDFTVQPKDKSQCTFFNIQEGSPEALNAAIEEADLVVSAHMDGFSKTQLDQILAGLRSKDTAAFLLRTPPGEAGVASDGSKPLDYWLAQIKQSGLEAFLLPQVDFSTQNFLYSAHDHSEKISSFLSSPIFVSSLGLVADAYAHRTLSPEPLTIERAKIRDQECLEAIHYANGFKSIFEQCHNASLGLQHVQEKLNTLPQQVEWLQHVAAHSKNCRGLSATVKKSLRLFLPNNLVTTPKDFVEAALFEAAGVTDQPTLVSTLEFSNEETARIAGDFRIGKWVNLLLSVSDEESSPPVQPSDKIVRLNAFDEIDESVITAHIYAVDRMTLRNLFRYSRLYKSKAVGEVFVCFGRTWLRLPRRTRLLPHPQDVTNFVTLAKRMLVQGAKVTAATLTKKAVRILALEGLLRRAAKISFALKFNEKKMTQAFTKLISRRHQKYQPIKNSVVHICGSLSPGGAERQLANMAISQVEAGNIDVHVLVTSLDESNNRANFHLDRVRAVGVDAREINVVRTTLQDLKNDSEYSWLAELSIPEHVLMEIANIAMELEKLRPEIVHCWLDWHNVRGGLAAVLAGVPKIVLSGRNIAPHNFKLHTADMRPAYSVLKDVPSVKLINNSAAGAKSYADWMGISSDRISVIHNGYLFDQPSNLKQEAQHLRETLGLTKDDIVVGGMFRLEHEKQPLKWIDAAAKVREKTPNAKFVVWGNGSLRSQTEQFVKELGFTEHVIFPGITEYPLVAMASMDVFLLSSYGEGLPNVIVEAQSVGTPVVTTAVGGAPEAVWDGKTGLVVHSDDTKEIAKAVVQIIENDQLRAAMSDAGPDYVKSKFSMDQSVENTDKVYRSFSSTEPSP